jgi:hypothetical protein
LTNKPFDPKADKKFSAILNRNITEILKTLFGHTVEIKRHDETTDWVFYDYVAKIGTEEVLVEGEVKSAKFWQHGRVRYPTVDVPARKGKNSAKVYVLLSSDENAFWACEMKHVLSSPKSPKQARGPDGKYRYEHFFNVDPGKGVYYSLNLFGNWIKESSGS